MLSLYLHIPFCRRKCAYCAFCSRAGDETQKERYTQALCHAAENAAKREERPLSTLYIGGGTPALLGVERLCRVMETVKQQFTQAPDLEFTVECNPESTTDDLLAALKAAGVNRISMGVQSLQNNELTALGRLHDRDSALEALARIFKAGFQNVSVDVMYGIPHQTEQSFADTLDTLLSYPITHLSSYALQLEEGTPLAATAQPMEEALEERLWHLLCERARAAGMFHYEISNFGKEGCFSRHNLAYWRRTDYIGLGASAHSFWCGTRYSAPEDLEEYCKNPQFSQNPIPISYAEAEEESILLGLRTFEGVPLTRLEGIDLSRYRDFSTIENGRFTLNERGYYLSNSIISDILYKKDITS